MPTDKVYIIGVAPNGVSSLSPPIHQLINNAEMVFGGRRLLEMFPSLNADKTVIGNNLAEVTDLIKKNLGHKRIVVLASGDPNFYGVAGHLTGELGKEVVEIHPNVSAIQLAFARIKENWEDAALISVHSRPIEDIIETVNHNNKVGILTDDKNSPARIARLLIENGIDDYRAYVCENLGEESEKITGAGLYELSDMKFSPLNILILLRDRQIKSKKIAGQSRLGIPDDEFYQRTPKAGLITKQEVRAVSLTKMRLAEDSVLWDIGAGSGAISIEASFLVRKGLIYAIEKNRTDVEIIRKNLKKFQTPNVEVVHTFAPENLDRLPAPTNVFIGGSGGKMEEILDFVSRRLKPGGRIVINVVALENLNKAINALNALGFVTDVTLVNIARSVNTKELTRLEALNPAFVISGALETNTKQDKLK